eukprot:PhM_4_TR182/c0_g1_i1/m.49288
MVIEICSVGPPPPRPRQTSSRSRGYLRNNGSMNNNNGVCGLVQTPSPERPVFCCPKPQKRFSVSPYHPPRPDFGRPSDEGLTPDWRQLKINTERRRAQSKQKGQWDVLKRCDGRHTVEHPSPSRRQRLE